MKLTGAQRCPRHVNGLGRDAHLAPVVVPRIAGEPVQRDALRRGEGQTECHRRRAVTEVGTRDGFQAEEKFIDTAVKAGIIDALIAAGLRRIEATSFVSPKAVPQLADAHEGVLYIGYAGGKSLFGLRSELQRHLGNTTAVLFRFEVNMQYLTRHKELLMLHKADHAQLPAMNAAEPPVRLGRLG